VPFGKLRRTSGGGPLPGSRDRADQPGVNPMANFKTGEAEADALVRGGGIVTVKERPRGRGGRPPIKEPGVFSPRLGGNRVVAIVWSQGGKALVFGGRDPPGCKKKRTAEKEERLKKKLSNRLKHEKDR